MRHRESIEADVDAEEDYRDICGISSRMAWEADPGLLQRAQLEVLLDIRDLLSDAADRELDAVDKSKRALKADRRVAMSKRGAK